MNRQRWFGTVAVNGALLLIVLLWTIPTLGLFISSFRTRSDILTSGWWNVFPHREWETIETLEVADLDLDPTGVMDVRGAMGTFEEMRENLRYRIADENGVAQYVAELRNATYIDIRF